MRLGGKKLGHKSTCFMFFLHCRRLAGVEARVEAGGSPELTLILLYSNFQSVSFSPILSGAAKAAEGRTELRDT